MDAEYWQRVGDRYELEIFDSSSQDLRGVIGSVLREHADPRAVAVDFGCGVGHHLPALAPLFREVYGLDFAPSLLEQARRRCQALPNVTLLAADLARPRASLRIPKARFALCANVLISSDDRQRRDLVRTLRRHLARQARAAFLVPSLESALFSNQRLIEWNRRRGFEPEDALASGIRPTARSAGELLRGLVRIDGVPTKHFLREEAAVLFSSEGFRLLRVEKVEYGWDTEFEKPPRWMREPLPWDWLFLVAVDPAR